MAEAKVTVAVEAAIHKLLRELAQKVRDDHGLCIRTVDFSWVGRRVGELTPTQVTAISVRTESGDV